MDHRKNSIINDWKQFFVTKDRKENPMVGDKGDNLFNENLVLLIKIGTIRLDYSHCDIWT